MAITKEQRAANWAKYVSKHRDTLNARNREKYHENIEERRKKNAERMRRVNAAKREATKEERAAAKAKRDEVIAANKALKQTPEYKASIRRAKKSLSQSNHEKFPDRPLKRGDVRADGMVFWRYFMERKADSIEDLEMWMTKEEFEPKNEHSRKEARKNMKLQCPRKLRIRGKENYKRNREKVRSAARERYKNPIHCMAHRCRATIQSIIRRRGWKKICKTNEMLGCDWETFKLHIEHSFLKGMTWDNRNLWHIDHYKPLATAKSIEDVKKLSHYTNLRPMWKQDNLKKNASLCHKGHQIPLLLPR